MSKMVQIRNMPDRLHRLLKARAAMAGMSLSDYLLRELESAARYPPIDEVRERLRLRDAVETPESTVSWVREDRDSR